MQKYRAGEAMLPCHLAHGFALFRFYTVSVSVTDKPEKFQGSYSACVSIQKFRCLSEPHLNYAKWLLETALLGWKSCKNRLSRDISNTPASCHGSENSRPRGISTILLLNGNQKWRGGGGARGWKYMRHLQTLEICCLSFILEKFRVQKHSDFFPNLFYTRGSTEEGLKVLLA